MEFTFDLPHVFGSESSSQEDAEALRVLLEGLIAVNRFFLRHHAVLPLYRAGVVYGRTTIWDSIPALYARGYGDCKTLSCALVAELRQQGFQADPVFRWIDRSDGGKDFHILVRRTAPGKIYFEDPSRKLGMGKNENRR